MDTPRILLLTVLVCLCNGLVIRKEIDSLTTDEALELRKSLTSVKDEKGAKGFSTIASYYGYPTQCPAESGGMACSIHGAPTFPQWHRLYVAHLEQALIEKGATVGIPYWDWTKSLQKIPDFLGVSKYSHENEEKTNPWAESEIEVSGKTFTTQRTVNDKLKTYDFALHALHALEYHSYCQFEVQFEILHNAIHFLVGGSSEYSMSNLDFASYDPLFYTHHSNMDRLYAIYEALYAEEGHVPGSSCETNCEICDIKGFQKELEPFNRETNPFPITRNLATGFNVTKSGAFDYNYDALSLKNLKVPEIKEYIHAQKKLSRSFAVYTLNGIKESVNVHIKVCKTKEDCKFAGEFFILGGSTERPWRFTRPYYHEISKTVLSMGLELNGNYFVMSEIYTTNNTRLSDFTLPQPNVEYRPAPGEKDEPLTTHDKDSDVIIREDVDDLTDLNELRKHLALVQKDTSNNGYQAIAAFHGEPVLCQIVATGANVSCSVIGQYSFPFWHRLFTVQMEDRLRGESTSFGLPYWDWTKPNAKLPELVKDEYYKPEENKEDIKNPFYDAAIDFIKERTSRDEDAIKSLNNVELREAILLALEQDNFCDFEVQFEIAHNIIHSLVGGKVPYGMSTLEYTAFDPLFYLHHSFLDKVWSLWMALQQHRGKCYEAHCALSQIHTPMLPFNDVSTNPNKKTFKYSTPTNIYDNVKELGYAFDKLEFSGMSIPELDKYIKLNMSSQSRIFVGVLLQGIQKSVKGDIFIRIPGEDKFKAGSFAVLGGPTEQPWRFDRLYKVDITKAMTQHNLNWNDKFEVTLEMFDFKGTPIEDQSLLPPIQLIYKAPEVTDVEDQSNALIRKNIFELSNEDKVNMREALTKLQEDTSKEGFEAIAEFVGGQYTCSQDGDSKHACSIHGAPTFPHWRRLFTAHVEHALRDHGSKWGVPYWDWTDENKVLPPLLSEENDNPFNSYLIRSENEKTKRDVNLTELFRLDQEGTKQLFHHAMNALDEDNFCDFEVQFEILHYMLHAMIGGSKKYSLATLDFAAFDPIFVVLQSGFDRIWSIWQELQILRKRPITSECAFKHMTEPLQPFHYPDVNMNELTRLNSLPVLVVNHTRLGYKFDKLSLRGYTVSEIEAKLKQKSGMSRTYIGLMLNSSEHSGKNEVFFNNKLVATVNILSGTKEKPWAYDRPYKIDVTDVMNDAGLSTDVPLNISITNIGSEVKTIEQDTILIERPADESYDILVVPITSNVHHSFITVKNDTRIKFVSDNHSVTMIDLLTHAAWNDCQFPVVTTARNYTFGQVHQLNPGNYYMSVSSPSQCKDGMKVHIHIEDD